MWIISNVGDCMVNTDHVVDIYYADTDVIALLSKQTGKTTVVIGRYDDPEQSRIALHYIFSNLENVTKSLQMPSVDRMHALMIGGNKPWHHKTGKKAPECSRPCPGLSGLLPGNRKAWNAHRRRGVCRSYHACGSPPAPFE